MLALSIIWPSQVKLKSQEIRRDWKLQRRDVSWAVLIELRRYLRRYLGRYCVATVFNVTWVVTWVIINYTSTLIHAQPNTNPNPPS